MFIRFIINNVASKVKAALVLRTNQFVELIWRTNHVVYKAEGRFTWVRL